MRKYKAYFFMALSGIILIFTFQNCSPTYFAEKSQSSTLGTNGGLSSGSTNIQKLQKFSVTSQVNRKVDILLVIDNSASMIEEQEKMSNDFIHFLANLGDLDYRIAITTTDVSEFGDRGGLRKFGGTDLTYIESNTPDGLALLQETVFTGIYGDTDEKGLTAIIEFIKKALIQPTKNANNEIVTTNEHNFLRPDAVLATVVVSDSDEAYSGGYLSATEYLTAFNELLPSKLYVNHSSIILKGDSQNCYESGETYGITYFEVSKATGGLSASICNPNYVDQLTNFAKTIVNKISEQTLECIPIDNDKDGIPDLDISYKSTTGATGKITNFIIFENKVRFMAPLNIVGDYIMTYSCLKP